MVKKDYFYGLGRRKASTARARLTAGGKGVIVINDKPIEDYFCKNAVWIDEVFDPLKLIGKEKDFNVSIKVNGGGLAGQVDACKLAIGKALSVMNDDLRSTLKKGGYLKRDSREKEPKKYGLRSARKREQFSKR